MPRAATDAAPRKRPPLFWWFLANVIAIALAIASWVVCLNLFRDPTHPTSYHWMMKVKRLEAPAAFEAGDLPTASKVNDPKQLEARFQPLAPSDHLALSQQFLGEYLTNYKKPKYLTYVTGEFRILEVRELNQYDFLSPGVAVKAQALARPDAVADPLPYPVFIECLFLGEDLKPESFPLEKTLMLEKQRDGAAIVNVSTTSFDDRDAVFVSVVPLRAGAHVAPDGTEFQITPPSMANPGSPLPIFP